jgi:hypothetical protein
MSDAWMQAPLRLRTRRACAAVALVAAAAALVACGGASATGGSTGKGSAVAFSACMRAHGVPNFPDPGGGGRPLEVDARQLGVGDALYQTAEHACLHLLPTGGSLGQLTHQCLLYAACPQRLVHRLMTVERRYAECMRTHGVPGWPDPSISPKGGRPVFDLAGTGLAARSTDAPRFIAGDRTCRRLSGGAVPSLPTTS